MSENKLATPDNDITSTTPPSIGETWKPPAVMPS
jgi:hypothetical protein